MNYLQYKTSFYKNDLGLFSVLIDDPTVLTFEKHKRWNDDNLEFYFKVKLEKLPFNYECNNTGYLYIINELSGTKAPTKFRIKPELLSNKSNK